MQIPRFSSSIFLVAGPLVVLFACKQAPPPPPPATPPAPAWGAQAAAPPTTEVAQPAVLASGTVVETMNAATYTYLLVDTGQQKIWAAAPQFDVKVGDRVTVPQGSPMRDFKSNTLNRTFELIYFVGAVTKGGSAPAAAVAAPPPVATAPAATPPGAPPVVAAAITGVALAPGGKRVEQVFASSAALAGKEVTVRGKVVKYNGGVMGKNWLHIQDGTGGPGKNDLTVTTNTESKVGDTVVIKGPVTLNKDFGYGYKYDVIVENALVTVE